MSSQDPNNNLPAVIDKKTPLPVIIAALEKALAADMVNRDGTRAPDHRVRVDAAKTLLAYRVGTPVQRSESVSVNVDADNALGLEERLRHSPALRALLRAALERAESPVIEAS